MDKLHIAQVAHEVNRAYCAALGDMFVPAWADATEAQRKSIAAGVDMLLSNPDATPEEQHDAWMAAKLADGWAYGEMKDAERKLHPCILPYAELPESQRVKDYLFQAVVRTICALPEPVATAPAAPMLSADEAAREAIAAKLALGTAVEFIGKRAWNDRLYGSGLAFVPGQVRRVPGDLARKLLRHADLFKAAPEDVATAQAAPLPADDTAAQLAEAAKTQAERDALENQRQNMIDTISTMDKDALQDFARNNYRVSIPKTLSVENMRAKAAALVDQFGVV